MEVFAVPHLCWHRMPTPLDGRNTINSLRSHQLSTLGLIRTVWFRLFATLRSASLRCTLLSFLPPPRYILVRKSIFNLPPAWQPCQQYHERRLILTTTTISLDGVIAKDSHFDAHPALNKTCGHRQTNRTKRPVPPPLGIFVFSHKPTFGFSVMGWLR